MKNKRAFHLERLIELWREEDGQDLIEYSLLMAFIALSIVSLLTMVGGDLTQAWTSISITYSSATRAAS